MKSVVTLDSKELKLIVSKALKIPVDAVIQQRYSIAISGYTTEEVEKMLKKLDADRD